MKISRLNVICKQDTVLQFGKMIKNSEQVFSWNLCNICQMGFSIEHLQLVGGLLPERKDSLKKFERCTTINAVGKPYLSTLNLYALTSF